MKPRGYKNFFGWHERQDIKLLRQLSGVEDLTYTECGSVEFDSIEDANAFANAAIAPIAAEFCPDDFTDLDPEDVVTDYAKRRGE